MSACCRIRLFLLAFCALTAGGFAQKGIITTFVGPGIPVDGAGALAQDFGPSAIAPDGAGGFYVSSYTRNQIYRVAADGTLKVIAGTGSAGFSGDNGPAVHASLNAPWGLAADAAGNIYFADSYNHRVRRITPEGLITTIAGDGTADSGGDGGPATSAHLYYPVEVAIAGSGTLYITDNSHRVRKLTPAGIISAVAGTGVAGYNGDGGAAAAVQLHYPRALALDSAGNLYIADMLNHRIRMVAADGTISTLAGTGVAGYSGNGGPATSAQLHSPEGIAFDSAGSLYISDSQNYRIRKVTADGIIHFVAGNGTGGYEPAAGLAASAWVLAGDICAGAYGDVYFVNGEVVRKITPEGIISNVAGRQSAGFNGDGLPASATHLNVPEGIAFDRDGNLYIADSWNHRIRKVTPAGAVSTFVGNGIPGISGDGGYSTSQVSFPNGIAFGPDGSLYIADKGNHRVRKVTPDGIISTVAGIGAYGEGGWGFSGDGGKAIFAQLSSPAGVAVGRDGSLYIADAGNHRVRKVTPDGIINTVAGNGDSGFSGDGGPATSAQLASIFSDIALDASGNLYIADGTNRRIRMVTPQGVISTVAGGGTDTGEGIPATSAKLGGPYGLTFDSAGNLYFADITTRVRKITPAGRIYTVAGTSRSGFSGDGGPAIDAQLDYPQAVALDAAGNLYISDGQNHRIRRVEGVTGALAFFPQIAVGGGYTTVFAIGNSGSGTVSGTLALADQQGNPLIVGGTLDYPGIAIQNLNASEFAISIPPGGVGFITARLPANEPVRAGWAKLDSWGGAIYSVATYEYVLAGTVQSTTGVLPCQPTQYATIPVDYDVSRNRRLGYAVANTGDAPITIKLAVVDQTGSIVDDSTSIILAPGEQIAKYLDQDLGRPQFKGSVVLRGQNKATFAAVALLQNQHQFTVVPVIGAKAPNIPE